MTFKNKKLAVLAVLSSMLSFIALNGLAEPEPQTLSIAIAKNQPASFYDRFLLYQLVPENKERYKITQAIMQRNNDYFTTATQITVILNAPQTQNIAAISQFINNQKNKPVVELSKAITKVLDIPNGTLKIFTSPDKLLVNDIRDARYPEKPSLPQLKRDLKILKEALQKTHKARVVANPKTDAASYSPVGSGGDNSQALQSSSGLSSQNTGAISSNNKLGAITPDLTRGGTGAITTTSSGSGSGGTNATTTTSSGSGGGGTNATTTSSGSGGGGTNATTTSSGSGSGGTNATTTTSSGSGGSGTNATTTSSGSGGGGTNATTTTSSGSGGGGTNATTTTASDSGGGGTNATTTTSSGSGGSSTNATTTTSFGSGGGGTNATTTSSGSGGSGTNATTTTSSGSGGSGTNATTTTSSGSGGGGTNATTTTTSSGSSSSTAMVVGNQLGCSAGMGTTGCQQQVAQKYNTALNNYNQALQDLNDKEKQYIKNDANTSQQNGLATLDQARTAFNTAATTLLDTQEKALAYYKLTNTNNSAATQSMITQINNSLSNTVTQSMYVTGHFGASLSSSPVNFSALQTLRLLDKGINDPSLLTSNTYSNAFPLTGGDLMSLANSIRSDIGAQLIDRQSQLQQQIFNLTKIANPTSNDSAELAIAREQLITVNQQITDSRTFYTKLTNQQNTRGGISVLVNAVRALQHARYAKNPWGKIPGLSQASLNNLNPASNEAKILALQNVDLSTITPADLLVLKTYLGQDITTAIDAIPSESTKSTLSQKLNSINSKLLRDSLSSQAAHDINQLTPVMQSFLNTFDGNDTTRVRSLDRYGLNYLHYQLDKVLGASSADMRGVGLNQVISRLENQYLNPVAVNTIQQKQLLSNLENVLPAHLKTLVSESVLNWKYSDISAIEEAIKSHAGLSAEFANFIDESMPGYPLRKTEINNIKPLKDKLESLLGLFSRPFSHYSEIEQNRIVAMLRSTMQALPTLPNATLANNSTVDRAHQFPFDLPGYYTSGMDPAEYYAYNASTTYSMQGLANLTNVNTPQHYLADATSQELASLFSCSLATCQDTLNSRVEANKTDHQAALTHLSQVKKEVSEGTKTAHDLEVAQQSVNDSAEALTHSYAEALSYYQSFDTSQASSTNPYQTQIDSLNQDMTHLAQTQAYSLGDASPAFEAMKTMSQNLNGSNSSISSSKLITLSAAELKSNLLTLSQQLSQHISDLAASINMQSGNSANAAQSLIAANLNSYNQLQLNTLNSLKSQVDNFSSMSDATLTNMIKLSNSVNQLSATKNPWVALKAIDPGVKLPLTQADQDNKQVFVDSLIAANQRGDLANLDATTALMFRTYLGNDINNTINATVGNTNNTYTPQQRQDIVQQLDNHILAATLGDADSAALQSALTDLTTLDSALTSNPQCSSSNQASCDWNAFNRQKMTVQSKLQSSLDTINASINDVKSSHVYTPQLDATLLNGLQSAVGSNQSALFSNNPPDWTVNDIDTIKTSLQNQGHTQLASQFNTYLEKTDYQQRQTQLSVLESDRRKFMGTLSTLSDVSNLFSGWSSPFTPIQYGARTRPVSRNYSVVTGFMSTTDQLLSSVHVPPNAGSVVLPGNFDTPSVRDAVSENNALLTNINTLSTPTSVSLPSGSSASVPTTSQPPASRSLRLMNTTPPATNPLEDGSISSG